MSDRRIKVLQMLPSLITGGGQRVALDLAGHLNPDVFDVKVVSLYPYSGKDLEIYAQENDIPVVYLNKKNGLDLSIFSQLYQVIKEFRPDVFHNHLYALYASIPAIVSLKIPASIHTIHTLAENEVQGMHFHLTKFAFKHLGTIPVSISTSVKQSAEEIFQLEDSPLIYNGVDTQKYAHSLSARQKVRRELGIPDSAYVLINVANLIEVKNQKLLLESFQQAVADQPDIYLIMVGDGPLRDELSELCIQLGIQDKVFILGRRPDIPALLSAADCFVLSSSREGFPISILEAMSNEKPIIATNVGGICELVVDNITGYLVESGNVQQLASAMIKMWNDPSGGQTMGAAGRKLILEQFSVIKMAEDYSQLYTDLLKEKGIEL